MESHELVNHIQQRLGKKIIFRSIIGSAFSQVDFEWGPNVFCAVGPSDIEDEITVLHVIDGEDCQQTLHSKYVQGVLNGGKRDDAGNLMQPTENNDERKN